MEHEIFLYPYSKAEAGRRGELDRWEESFRANVSCAREIEAAIRGYSNVDGILQPGAAQSILNQWGFKRTNFVLRHTHATQLLANGIPLLEVSKRLGHSRASHTLDLYGHSIPGYDASLPNKISKIFNL